MLPCFARQVGDECICSVEVLRRLVEQRFCHRRLAAIELSCLGGVSGLQNGPSHQCDRIRPELVPGTEVERLVTVVVDLDGRGQVSQSLQCSVPSLTCGRNRLGHEGWYALIAPPLRAAYYRRCLQRPAMT